nr:phage major capsid protein [uncultured Mediterranean phage uvMED]
MEEQRDLEGKPQLRHFSELLDSRELNEEERTIDFPFSSETPVNRGLLGDEILIHREDSIDFSRLNASAPLLWMHDPSSVIGVVERAYLDKKKKQGRATVRFARNAAGEEALQMVKDKIYRNVSFGYSVDETEEGQGNSYRVTKFTPAEVSLVSTPADFSVGLGRKLATNTQEQPIIKEEREQSPPSASKSDASPVLLNNQIEMTDTPDLSVVRSEAEKKARNEERSRIATINALTTKHGFSDLGRQLVENGSSIDQAREAVLDQISAKPTPTVSAPEIQPEVLRKEKYSLIEAIKAGYTRDFSSRAAGFAREISQEVERSGVNRTKEQSILVPYAALQRNSLESQFQRATYNTGSANTGGNLVETELLDQDFVEALRNESLLLTLGARTMTGLVGNIDIPRRSGVSTMYWLANQTTAITQSESTFDQISMAPKNAGVLSKFTRQTLLQATPGIEGLIRDDLRETVGTGVDLAILNGTGSSGQPTGIMQTSGIGSVAGGTNGADITLEHLVDLEKEVLIDNAGGGSMAYLTNPKVVAKLKKLRAGGSATGDGVFLWNTNETAIGRGSTPGGANGYTIGSTNQVPSNLTKGSASSICSAVLFGDFSQAIVGFWGNGLELAMSDSDSTDFTKALTAMRAIITIDVAVRRAEAFSIMLDAKT